MASRGYAVLQVNFRGSEGLGMSLLEAGYGQWGRKMQTDLSDGVRYLTKEGIVDPKRVCIVGASYGGYAALAGAALDPGVYRCAVSVAGPADLRRFVDWSKGYRGRAAYRYWTRFMGAEDSRDAVLAEISPAAHADRVAVPVQGCAAICGRSGWGPVMSVLRTLAAMAAAIIFAGSAAAAPLDAYGKLPTIETGAVSPSGASVALIVTNGEDRAILVRNVAT